VPRRRSPLDQVLARALNDRAFFQALRKNPAAAIKSTRMTLSARQMRTLSRAVSGKSVPAVANFNEFVRRLHRLAGRRAAVGPPWRSGHWR